MRVLIVGCGYVGLPLGVLLAQLSHTVFGLRRTRAAEHELIAAGIEPLVGDITRPDELAALPRDFDWVIDCVSSTGGSAADYREVYYTGALNLIAWLRNSQVQKLVFTSSTSVYGQTDGSIVDECSPILPESETARVLVETEHAFLRAAREQAAPAMILRVAAIYGPGRGYWLNQFLNSRATIDGSGGRFFNMIHRDDVAGAIVSALRTGRIGEIYNAVDDEPVSQVEYFSWLASKLQRPMPPSTVEENRREAKRGFTNKRVSNKKLRTELGYHFKYPTFREGCTAELESAG